MAAWATHAFWLLLLALDMQGAVGTKQYPFTAALSSPYQFLGQPTQAVSQQSLLSQPQTALQQSLLAQPQAGMQQLQVPTFDQQVAPQQQLASSQLPTWSSLPGSAAQLPAQFLQQDLAQPPLPAQPAYLQPLAPSSASNDASSLTDLSQVASSLQVPNIMASVPMQQVLELMRSAQALQQKTQSLQVQLYEAHAQSQGLERQLSEVRAHESSTKKLHEKQLNDLAITSAQRSNSIDQSARKLASLAQASVAQAKKSVDKQKTEIDTMKAQLAKLEKEKADLVMDLAQSHAQLDAIEDKNAGVNTQDISAMLSAWKKEGQLKSTEPEVQQPLESQSPNSLAQLSDAMYARVAPGRETSMMQEPLTDSFAGIDSNHAANPAVGQGVLPNSYAGIDSDRSSLQPASSPTLIERLRTDPMSLTQSGDSQRSVSAASDPLAAAGLASDRSSLQPAAAPTLIERLQSDLVPTSGASDRGLDLENMANTLANQPSMNFLDGRR